MKCQNVKIVDGLRVQTTVAHQKTEYLLRLMVTNGNGRRRGLIVERIANGSRKPRGGTNCGDNGGINHDSTKLLCWSIGYIGSALGSNRNIH